MAQNLQTAGQVEKQAGQMGKWARYYDLLMSVMTLGTEGKLRQMTLRLAQLKPGDKVLEIGCGTGTLSLAAKNKVGPSGLVTGIDIAPEMVAAAKRKAARKKVDVSFREGSIAAIPFSDSSFDLVMCSFMIFHMPAEVRLKGLAEIYRVLKSGGHLFILDAATKDKRYDVRELPPVLMANSFSGIELQENKFLFMTLLSLRAAVVKK